ncbi:MAG: response regulator transcription factor [Nitrospirae bacterium]|nr:response regulator transcription factor [Nitrospirota bacterium]
MINILIADDHAIVREGLKQILAETHDLVVKGEARNGHEVLHKVRTGAWDVVILDLAMPGPGGLDIVKELKRERPHLPLLVLSIHPEDQYAVRVLQAGASGYMTKESAPEELITAIRKVTAGGKYISQYVAEKLVRNLGRDAERPPHEALSDREYQVMCLIASGKTVKEVATEMALSAKTVSTYRARILEKMKMKSNADLIRYGLRHQLVD